MIDPVAIVNQIFAGAVIDRGDLPVNIGKVSGMSVILVDADKVKLEHDMDFVEGGNGYAKKYIPKSEVWIDASLKLNDLKASAIHEVTEAKLMAGGKSYDEAHVEANVVEKKYRQSLVGGVKEESEADAYNSIDNFVNGIIQSYKPASSHRLFTFAELRRAAKRIKKSKGVHEDAPPEGGTISLGTDIPKPEQVQREEDKDGAHWTTYGFAVQDYLWPDKDGEMDCDHLLMHGEFTTGNLDTVEALVRSGWPLNQALIFYTTMCSDCANIVSEFFANPEKVGSTYGPDKWSGTSCKYCEIIKANWDSLMEARIPSHSCVLNEGETMGDMSKSIDEAVDAVLEAQDDAEVKSFEQMADVMLDMRKFIERARKIDVADDKLLQQAIADATSLVRDIESGDLKDRKQIATKLQGIVSAMKDSNAVDHEDDEIYRNIAKKYNLNI